MPATILVVDDEPPLRRLMQAFLQRMGYEVVICGDATTAHAEFDRQPGRFHLVVADLSLPDQPGQEMALAMLLRQPGLRILLCSGYPFELETLPEDCQWHFASLQKPFVPSMLTSAVRELLKRD